MKKFFTLMSIVLIGLTSCTLEDDNSTNTDYVQDVFIKLENAGQPGTRASEPSKGDTDADKVTFSSGYIFFITRQGSIKKCYRIAPAGTATDLTQNVISISEFWDGASNSSAGYLFQNVSGEVTQVYVIGNIPDSGTTAENVIRSQTTLTKLKELTIPVTEQNKIDLVTMDGLATTLTTVEGSDGTKKKADITLTPLCSRIEIAKITSTGNVTGYKLQGIYVSHFYSEIPLNETAIASTQQLYSIGGGGTDYSQTYACMCDEATIPDDGLGTQSNAVTTPTTSDNVWAYQFLPGTNTGRISPRIIIKLNGVTASIGNFDANANYFLNIRGFKASGAGDVDPMSVSRGKIYKIANISFKENDISDIPNPADISLTVTVSVKNWVVETVEPVM